MYSTTRFFTANRMLCTVLAGVLVLGGCASRPKSFEIKAVADPVVNRDVAGRPLSVVVHIYQLKDSGEFSKLTIDTLASGRPLSDLLGKDLLNVNEVMLVPGGTETRTDKIHPDAKHVGVIAFFRQPDQHYWRVLADAEQVRSSGIHFKVQDCFISLVAPKPSVIPGQPAVQPLSCSSSDIRAAAAVAGPASTTRTHPPVSQPRRNGALDTARQAADSFLTRKP